MATLGDLAIKSHGKLYSKNASPFMLVVDILLGDRAIYERVKRSGLITKELVADLYKLPIDDVYGVYFHDGAMGIKISFYKRIATGDPGNSDCYGAQQHVPLLNLEIPEAR